MLAQVAVSASLPKLDALQLIAEEFAGLKIVETDFNRPWGGYFRFDDSDVGEFIGRYFSGLDLDPAHGSLSPKVLVIEPGLRFSYQYHERREEHWVVLRGPAVVHVDYKDVLPEPKIFEQGQTLYAPVGMRHAIGALETRVVLPEIWRHTDPAHPSDELDIKRLDDLFGRI